MIANIPYESPSFILERRVEEDSHLKRVSSFTTPLIYVMPEKHRLTDFIQNDIRNLKDNWDGYGGNEIDENVIAHSIHLFNDLPNAFVSLLNKDSITPTPNGTITIVWENEKNELFLEIGNKYSTYYIKHGEETQFNNSFDISNSKELAHFTRELRKYFFD
jgi:hypothetical protein